MKTKRLLFVLLALLGLYAVNRIRSEKNSKNFQTELIQTDTAKITAFVIANNREGKELTFKREGKYWIVSNGQRTTKAITGSVNPLLSSLALIQTRQIVAYSPDQWPEYQVDDQQGTRIRLFEGNQLTEDFILGRFHAANAYVRLSGQNEVYAVNGLPLFVFQQPFDAYRNHDLLVLDPKTYIRSVSVQLNDSTTLVFFNENGSWGRPEGSYLIDSLLLDSFLLSLNHLTGKSFADDFDELQADRYRLHQIALDIPSLPDPILITCYRDSSRTPPFILHSSFLPDVFFESDSAGLYKTLFGLWQIPDHSDPE